MMAICERFPFGTLDAKQRCQAAAGTYYEGVKHLANGAYEHDQDIVCVCDAD